MWTFEQIKTHVYEHIHLIEISAAAIADSRNRAAKFLVIQCFLADHIKVLEDTKVKASTIEKATYAQVLLGASGKKVTEVKIIAQGDPQYAASRESVELIDAELNWTKKHFDIFNNAHIMFRQYSQSA